MYLDSITNSGNPRLCHKITAVSTTTTSSQSIVFPTMRQFSSSSNSLRRRPFPHDRNANNRTVITRVAAAAAATSAAILLLCGTISTTAFMLSSPATTILSSATLHNNRLLQKTPTTNVIPNSLPGTTATPSSSSSTTTALNVWWFGGTEQGDNSINDGDSCELVAVRIERTSPNSRRIAGEISVPAPLEDVWSILTDYNRLAIHVPNLMESKVVRENSQGGGSPGDGSYKCRLYQVGAQKIIGFDFSASVTMDMSERIIASAATPARKIDFKCVDSQFFSEFDGAWTVKEQRNQATGDIETLCSYVVDVRPKGPVPVAALEWRIREDVPTNLRAVKAATVAMNPTTAAARTLNSVSTAALPQADPRSASRKDSAASRRRRNDTTKKTPSSSPEQQVPVRLRNNQGMSQPMPRFASVVMDWDVDETMGKYL